MPIVGSGGPVSNSVIGASDGLQPDTALYPAEDLFPANDLYPRGGQHVPSLTVVNTHLETGQSVVSSTQSAGANQIDGSKTGITVVSATSVIGRAG